MNEIYNRLESALYSTEFEGYDSKTVEFNRKEFIQSLLDCSAKEQKIKLADLIVAKEGIDKLLKELIKTVKNDLNIKNEDY